MAPTPQEDTSICHEVSPEHLDEDSIVISGISGIYPQANSVKELSEILYNKVNPITKARWGELHHPEVPPCIGFIPKADRFDAQFFKVNYYQGEELDIMSRKILEQSHQAIYDAGITTESLYGKNVGVYIASSNSEFEKAVMFEAAAVTGYSVPGCSKSMFANRVSFSLNVKGPSLSINAACCGSITALQRACLAIKQGDCEAAIVGGCNLCWHPQSSIHFGRIMPLCKDGKTKSFDESADGFARSEAINILFLQKAKDARRIYAEVVHAKTEYISELKDEHGPKFGYYRDPKDVATFLNEFYNEAKVSPHCVDYIEALGSAVPEADKAELDALEYVFCKNRTNQLLVGSVTSNIGNCDAAAGIAAITKVLLGYHTGILAGNLHCNNPRQDVMAIRDGRMRIVTEHQRIGHSYIGINSASVDGINAHVLLRGYYRPKNVNCYKSSIPYLIAVSGRLESCVQSVLDDFKRRPIDPEELSLMHSIYEEKKAGHMARGYIILDTTDNETVSFTEKVDYFDDSKRPLWFVYSGMGSQRPGMGAQLLRIPTFAAAIERCHRVLEPKGVHLKNIITTLDKNIFDNILHSFVGITAIQIGITDVLTELGIVPDRIIGHSLGETACAYADGCFTAEETILATYCRGLVSIQTPLIRGSMAAIGIGYQKISKLCPPEIEVGCHNGPDSSTISGPADLMKEFVGKLTAHGIFAKEVPCSNIAYHSRYIADAGPKLLELLSKVIQNPKPRSKRWLSTSIPFEHWTNENSKYSSAWYHTNNLLSPVLFEEILRIVPANAILVEVAPHGLMQAILRRSMPSTCLNLPLTLRGHVDNTLFLLDGIGRLYMEGYNPKITALYPKVEFPVSTGTPLMSHLLEWSHDEKWKVPYYLEADRRPSSTRKLIISVYDDDHSYLQGNVLRGKTVYPFAAVLVAVWDTLAMALGVEKKQISVQYRDVHLFSQPVLHDEKHIVISVTLHKGTGQFEVMNEYSKVVTGYIIIMTNNEIPKKLRQPIERAEEMYFDSQDIYEILEERDYAYTDNFVSIIKASQSFMAAQLSWHNNWVTFIDSLIQLNVLRHKHESISQPSHIKRISIDVNTHANNKLFVLGGKTAMEAIVSKIYDYTRCGGVLIETMKFYNLPPPTAHSMILKTSPIQTNCSEDVLEELSYDERVTLKQEVTLRRCKTDDLNSLQWVQSNPFESDIKVTVHYAAINDLDYKRASGIIPMKQDGLSEGFGMDYSGTTDSGQRVMGIVPAGAVSSTVRALPELMWPVPPHWTLEDAATVPLAYALAFYCLGIRSKLYAGMTVLVHGGSGALGQAAIAIALANGCKIFTTVGDVRKKTFLRRLFPDLKDENIGNSRDETFGDMVLQATKGRGCDIIITCAKGYLRNVILKCGSYCGITFDTTLIHDADDYRYGMYSLTKQRSYVVTDFASIFNSKEDMKELQGMVSNGISCGYVRPLTRVTYVPGDVSRAFHILGASRHRGRVLLRLRDSLASSVHRRISCSPDLCHLVICDEDGFGLQLANRLVQRGVKILQLHCPKISTRIHHKVQTWQKEGVLVELSSVDTSKNKGVLNLLMESIRLKPIEGIYVIMPGFVQDAQFTELSSFLCNLDLLSRESCPFLRYFAVISTEISIGRETCMKRAHNHLPATLLHLPARSNQFMKNSYGGVSWRSVLDATESALCSNKPLVLAYPRIRPLSSLLEQLALIAHTELPQEMNTEDTLQSLGLHSCNSQAVSIYLQNMYNVSIAEEDIPLLTVQTIKEIEGTSESLNKEIEGTSESLNKEVKGLDTFFSHVDTNELLATFDVVFMPTLIKEVMRADEFDPAEQQIFIVPGLEGTYGRFQSLSHRLKLPTLVLQPGLHHLKETPRDTAERFVQVLMKKTIQRNDFYLLGFESGVITAMEIASILEEKGLTGTVFCVGGLPEDIQAIIENGLGNLESEESIQFDIAKHMTTLMADDEVNIEAKLNDATSWQEKVDACVSAVRGGSYSTQYARLVIKAAYARIGHAIDYKMQLPTLRSRVVVLRTSSGSINTTTSTQYYSHEPIVTYDLPTSLAHALEDPRCATYINMHLGKKVLQEYEGKNLCQTYIVNSQHFMINKQMPDDE